MHNITLTALKFVKKIVYSGSLEIKESSISGLEQWEIFWILRNLSDFGPPGNPSTVHVELRSRLYWAV